MKVVNGVRFILLLALISALVPGVALAQNTFELKCDFDVVVQSDDWLSKLADKFYGETLAFPIIAQATNTKALTDTSYTKIENVNMIEPGWKLCIPNKAIALAILGETFPKW